MADTGINVGGSGSRRKLRRVLVSTGLVLAVVVLAGGVGAGLRWWQNREHSHNDTNEAGKQELTDIQKQTLMGDYDKAQGSIQSALADPALSDQDKINLYTQEGATYENQQNYAAAIESYQKAEAIEPTQGLVQAIAGLAVRIDNKQLAITYYRKAIDLLPAESKTPEAVQYFEKLIKDLEGGQ